MSDIPPETLFPFLSPLSEPELLVDILSRLPVKSLVHFRMMKNYGVKESWHKLISIPSAKKSFQHVRLFAYSESSGKVLMEEEIKRLAWYDLKTKIVKKVKLHCTASPFVADVYLGNLPQLNSGGAIDSDAKKQQAKEKKKNVKRDEKWLKLAL